MTYVLQCPACGHDASEHGSAPDDECLPVDSKGHFCWITAASLYAAECERLMGLLQPMPQRIATLTTAQLHAEAERDAARAECAELWAVLDGIADHGWSFGGDVHFDINVVSLDDARRLDVMLSKALARVTARTALDGGNDATR